MVNAQTTASLANSSTTGDEAGRSDGLSEVESLDTSLDRSGMRMLDNGAHRKSLITCSHISNEYVRLTELLDSMHAEEVKDLIERRLDKRDTNSIVALSILFPRASFPPVRHLHCVRCHRNYDPTQKTNCTQRHPNGRVRKVGENMHGATFHCSACDADFRLNKMFFYDENVNSYMTGLCYHGSHTTNPHEVDYSAAARTCEENGCVEFYV
ncbi:hypothetical protein NP493_53g03029 [Ridgeia piscesae]|uniref:Uncharacterized protein n=1 Tax=Ridgeia piscesae TaxID=27915 RepID=A0AAD9PBA0_RIDPI|nr:hypothetical protein NP493_53g03029 [Ridgeia piscesae]